jgi:hypothetical protein
MQTEFPSNGMIFGENAMKVTNLEGLQDGGSRLGQIGELASKSTASSVSARRGQPVAS